MSNSLNGRCLIIDPRPPVTLALLEVRDGTVAPGVLDEPWTTHCAPRYGSSRATPLTLINPQHRCARARHGKRGLGDGDAPRSLLPSPALLAFMIQRPIAVDEYLLWSIAEGGKQFETEMPAFKDTLNREDIWKIIAYMRAGFPEPGKVPALK